ncbi:rop guanine nucleotide exchange factor 12-like [Thalictrum thalictroides]|uniref:Rop guanine nucleotide exchange factor 12-like n=1 Tax=Thalictrum thalictroides TaxID=46969 RepID=A0A7J6X7J6_THATH|nr:rop guanine nucleotide exchange factor 12-like [Thalictrum thalictroides]
MSSGMYLKMLLMPINEGESMTNDAFLLLRNPPREILMHLFSTNITVEFFNPEQFLSAMDRSSEHKILELKNRIEAFIVIWRRTMIPKDGNFTLVSSASIKKKELCEKRAYGIFHSNYKDQGHS